MQQAADESSRPNNNIVIIGGGHAGASLCAALHEAGLGAQVHLVCAEDQLPYQRPPLSKSFLKNPAEAPLPHKKQAWFEDAGITVHLGDPAVSIDPGAKRVTLGSGKSIEYQHLVSATGTRARRLPSLPTHLDNVVVLRTAADALAVRDRLHAASSVTVLGGGFIGLEAAAAAQALGKTVQVLEAAPRLLARAVSPELSAHVAKVHEQSGISVLLNAQVGHFEFDSARLHALQVNGQRQSVELVLLGIGAEPEQQLAVDAGLHTGNGIVVDEFMQTSDPNIWAAGDCTNFAMSGADHRIRLESVQNAMDQARIVVASITGKPQAYRPTPWFWSDQGGLRLQMVGLVPQNGKTYRRTAVTPDGAPESFSLLHYVGDKLVCVESVNNPQDHLASRKLLESGKSPAPEAACDASVAMRSFLT